MLKRRSRGQCDEMRERGKFLKLSPRVVNMGWALMRKWWEWP